MRIAIVGAGRVGSTLGRRLGAAGHHVLYGVRAPDDPKYNGLEVETVEEAADSAEVIVLAVPWRAARDAVEALGDVGDRIVVDVTNPFTEDRDHIRHPELSGTEQIRGWLRGGRLVKAFNTTGSGNLGNPHYPHGAPVMFAAGEDPEAKKLVLSLAAELGFEAVDAGGMIATRDLEHLATLWVRLAYGLGHGPDIAFALLKR
jgi:predicted dinucleotide-binding enzyme